MMLFSPNPARSEQEREEERQQLADYLRSHPEDNQPIRGAVSQTDADGKARIKHWRESVTEDKAADDPSISWKNIQVEVPEGVFEEKPYVRRDPAERVRSLTQRIYDTCLQFQAMSDGQADQLMRQLEDEDFKPGRAVSWARCERIAIKGLRKAEREARLKAKKLVTAEPYHYH